ncbi:MAG: hypothetical protein JWO47_47 [Candidatus Saccharibacteria bacterium]|nr:hypothetical protein [Candidatus Saccharibacteria bacterium]
MEPLLQRIRKWHLCRISTMIKEIKFLKNILSLSRYKLIYFSGILAFKGEDRR